MSARGGRRGKGPASLADVFETEREKEGRCSSVTRKGKRKKRLLNNRGAKGKEKETGCVVLGGGEGGELRLRGEASGCRYTSFSRD